METCRNEAERHRNYVFTTAIEGGINYWANVLTYKWAAPDPNAYRGKSEARDFSATIREYDSGDILEIDPSIIRRGIKRAFQYMRDNLSEYDTYQRAAISDLNYGNWEEVDYDATTADIVVQFGLFGELIYA